MRTRIENPPETDVDGYRADYRSPRRRQRSVGYCRVPTNQQVRQTIAHLNNLKPSPDAVIASGDLTDRGRDEEYSVLRELLSPLKVPVFVTPSNHNNLEALLKCFADQVICRQPDHRS